MNNTQENFFSICLRVEARLDANPGTIASFAALETVGLAFKNRIATNLIATTTLTGVA